MTFKGKAKKGKTILCKRKRDWMENAPVTADNLPAPIAAPVFDPAPLADIGVNTHVIPIEIDNVMWRCCQS